MSIFLSCFPCNLVDEICIQILKRERLAERGIFTLAQYPIVDGQTDVFTFIRCFADEWNINMLRCVTPDRILVVDESMGQWLGKGMPGLMHVVRKPIPQMEKKGILLLTVKLGV